MRLLWSVFGALFIASLAIALWPEPPAKPIVGMRMEVLHGQPRQPIVIKGQKGRDLSVEPPIVAASRLYRSWSDEGLSPLELRYGPIAPTPYLAITYQGTIRDRDGRNALYLQCTSTGQTRPVSSGGSNTAILEVVTPLPPSWCPKGDVYLHMRAYSASFNLGVAEPYQSSAIALLKRSYIGKVAYFLVAFAAAGSVFFLGGVIARWLARGLDPVISGLLAIGAVSMAMFYAYAWTPLPAPAGAVLIVGSMFGALAIWRSSPQLARSVWRAQRAPLAIWFTVSFAAFTLLLVGSTGSGVWEPNYRYAPAIWSSDNTLPMLLAEAARIGSLTSEGLIGPWSLSDRPPLMAGGYLLLGDMFAALQVNNQGRYLQPVVLGLGGIVFSALWSVTFYWAARRIGRLSAPLAALGTLLIAATPFALFNTGYTWPKLLAAAFSVMATAYVFRSRPGPVRPGEASVFGALAGFAILSHAASALFLAPVAGLYFLTRLWRAPKALMVGVGVGLIILASWSAFKATALPSSDPLLKFALTGDFAFERPEQPLSELLVERYEDLDLATWIGAKAEMGAYLFTPFPKPGPLRLNRPDTAPESSSDHLGYLRNWDFYSLSIGNVAILLLTAACGVLTIARASERQAWRPSGLLLAAALLCYALFLLVTFLPLVAHQFSYDAILAGALAGVIALGREKWGQRGLVALLAATALYIGLVWLAPSLRNLVTLDLVSLVVIFLCPILVAFQRRIPAAPKNVALALVPIGGALIVGAVFFAPRLVAQPGPAAVAPVGTSPASVPLVAPGRCLGRLDDAVQRKAGGWRVYGWAWDVGAQAPATSVSLRTLDGQTIATGRVDQERTDVVAGVSSVTSSTVGWFIDIEAQPNGLVAIASLANGDLCRLPDGPPP
jgi:hypothetical protein